MKARDADQRTLRCLHGRGNRVCCIRIPKT
jgi:hypothetical protein